MSTHAIQIKFHPIGLHLHPCIFKVKFLHLQGWWIGSQKTYVRNIGHPVFPIFTGTSPKGKRMHLPAEDFSILFCKRRITRSDISVHYFNTHNSNFNTFLPYFYPSLISRYVSFKIISPPFFRIHLLFFAESKGS